MNTIIFGTPEANELLKADKATQKEEPDLRELEYQDLRNQRREVMHDLRWAEIQGFHDEIENLGWLLAYINQELEKYPTPADERAAIQRWNEWATGNPAAVNVYLPGQTWPPPRWWQG